MSSMFSRCESLMNLDVSNFNTSNVIYIRGMFDDCKSLMDLDVSHFDTGNVFDKNWLPLGKTNGKFVNMLYKNNLSL